MRLTLYAVLGAVSATAMLSCDRSPVEVQRVMRPRFQTANTVPSLTISSSRLANKYELLTPQASLCDFFSATVYDNNGNQVVNAVVTWTVSDTRIIRFSNTGGATDVTIFSEPVCGTQDFTGSYGYGYATLTAAWNSSSDVVQIDFGQTTAGVQPFEADITPLGAVVYAGSHPTDQTTFTATGTDAFGSRRQRPATWTSDNTTLATITATGTTTKSVGTATGLRYGTVHISAKMNGTASTKPAVLTVLGVTSIHISPSPVIVPVGATVQMTGTTYDQNGGQLAVAPTWTSSNTAVATVAATTGVIRGVSKGTATITATAQGVSASASAIVYIPAVINGLTTNPTPAQQYLQFALTITGTGFDPALAHVIYTQNCTPAGPACPSETIPNNGLASKASTQLVIAAMSFSIAPSTIYLQVQNDPAVPSSNIQSMIVPGVASVTVSPASVSIIVGNQPLFTAQAYDPGGKPVTVPFVWTSSNTAVATVDANGRVTGKAAGSATISATAQGVTGTATVTVGAIPAIASATTTPSPAKQYTPFSLTINGSGFDAATAQVIYTQNCTPAGPSCPSETIANGQLASKSATQLVVGTLTFGTAGTIYFHVQNGPSGPVSNTQSIVVAPLY